MSPQVSQPPPSWRQQRRDGFHAAHALGTALVLLVTIPVALLIGGVIAGWFGVR